MKTITRLTCTGLLSLISCWPVAAADEKQTPLSLEEQKYLLSQAQIFQSLKDNPPIVERIKKLLASMSNEDIDNLRLTIKHDKGETKDKLLPAWFQRFSNTTPEDAQKAPISLETLLQDQTIIFLENSFYHNPLARHILMAVRDEKAQQDFFKEAKQAALLPDKSTKFVEKKRTELLVYINSYMRNSKKDPRVDQAIARAILEYKSKDKVVRDIPQNFIADNRGQIMTVVENYRIMLNSGAPGAKEQLKYAQEVFSQITNELQGYAAAAGLYDGAKSPKTGNVAGDDRSRRRVPNTSMTHKGGSTTHSDKEPPSPAGAMAQAPSIDLSGVQKLMLGAAFGALAFGILGFLMFGPIGLLAGGGFGALFMGGITQLNKPAPKPTPPAQTPSPEGAAS